MLINIHPSVNDHIIKEWLESNICICTGYEDREKAVKSVLNQGE
ncbi:MAG: hypothetical protein VB130_08910 [Clostridium sp.]|nr:hypothetical protein [Clostridium sp.]